MCTVYPVLCKKIFITFLREGLTIAWGSTVYVTLFEGWESVGGGIMVEHFATVFFSVEGGML